MLNLIVYHGVFAPNARWRCDAVRRAREGAEAGTTVQTGSAHPSPTASDAVVATTGTTVLVGSLARQSALPGCLPPTAATNAATAQPTPSETYKWPTHYAWPHLLRRTFAIDVLTRPECGGRLRLLATFDDQPLVEKILHHLGLPVEAPAPARTPAWLPSALPIFDGVEGPASLWSY